MARPNPMSFFNNLASSDLPIRERLSLAAKNTAYKMKNGTDCCGNHGEPGC
ncbi:MAG: hypothetical protein ACR2N2_10055 [Acidimicrobiia bacterium]